MHGVVVSTTRLTPGLVRIRLGGGDLHRLTMPDATDAYVNIAIAPEGAPYGAVFDPRDLPADLPRELRPARRRYTVRRWDPAARLLDLDFVTHASGVAGAWAERAETGDVLVLEGASGGYRPDPSADWHLLVGDESALPAIAASLEALGPDDVAVCRLVCDGPDHEVALETAARLDLRWLHRHGQPDDAELLPDAVADLSWLPGRVHAFVHGEAEEIRALRRHLILDRGLDRATMSCSPYWRRTMTDEAWREVKRDFVARMEAEVA